MLEYDRIDTSKWIDVNKTTDWHECIVCHLLRYISDFRQQYLMVVIIQCR